MGKPVFLDPLDYVSGKISKRYLTVYNHRRASDRRYTQVRGDRSTPPSTEELERRLKFKVVRQAAQDRSMNLSVLTRDQMKFIEERKTLGARFKYSTYRGWLFGKAWNYYDDNTNTVVWPQNL